MNALNKEMTLAPASLLPKPYSRLSSSIGTKGGRLQLSVGFTVSMCELRRTVGFSESNSRAKVHTLLPARYGVNLFFCKVSQIICAAASSSRLMEGVPINRCSKYMAE